MTIRKILATLPASAVGGLLWRRGLWLDVAEITGADGTCQGLEALACKGLAVGAFLIGVLVLVLPHRVLFEVFRDDPKRAAGKEKTPALHPSQDTTHLFY